MVDASRKPTPKSERVNMTFNGTQWEFLQGAAQRSGRSIPEVVRGIVGAEMVAAGFRPSQRDAKILEDVERAR